MIETKRILIVDDEPNARDALAEILRDEGYATEVASDGAKALSRIAAFDPHVVLTDLKMPGLDGIALLTEARALHRFTVFVVMTAFGSIETAVEAIKKGAENYITKPLDPDAVSALVARAYEKAALIRETAQLRSQLSERFAFGSILGSHPAMQRLLKMVAQVADSRATALIVGESGTGKELIAAAIHHNSPRKNGPFVRLNCASLSENLLESELFGHERGSFTGAVGRREGRFEQAHRGTLFLDEISEVPLPMQVKLLRFLQEREFERVGGNDTIRVDVRIVAATNRDLPGMVAEGRFREDLYYRLNVVQLDVPPLRARRSDIPLLAHHFLKRYAEENGRTIEGFSDDALRLLVGYAWPGNVRELENAIERAVVLCQATEIDVDLLPTGRSAAMHHDINMFVPGLSMAELERLAIERTLEAVDGSTAKAAELLGVSQRKIQYRVKEWGITTARGSTPPNGS